jgi:hypothetical protein
VGSSFYRPKNDFLVVDGSEVLKDVAHEIAVDQLIPRIARRNQIAVETIQTRMHLYHRLLPGQDRRCSCFDVEISPSSLCRVCYGTGVVGGYTKYGTNLAVLDVTHPSVRTVGIIPDYTRRSRPRHFVLQEGATRGYLVTRIPLQTTTGVLDMLYVQHDAPPGTQLDARIQAPSDPTPVVFTRDALAARLFNPWVEVRINMERSTVATPSPRFGALYFRYERFEDKVLLVNVPRRERKSMLTDTGLTDEWNPQSFWTDNKAKYIGEQDLLFDLDTDRRWKITQVSANAPQEKLLSWDLQARLLRNYESETKFPI